MRVGVLVGGSGLGESLMSSSDGNLTLSGSTAPMGGLLGRAKGKQGGRQQVLCRRNLSGRDALVMPLCREAVCPQGSGYGGCPFVQGVLLCSLLLPCVQETCRHAASSLLRNLPLLTPPLQPTSPGHPGSNPRANTFPVLFSIITIGTSFYYPPPFRLFNATGGLNWLQ